MLFNTFLGLVLVLITEVAGLPVSSKNIVTDDFGADAHGLHALSYSQGVATCTESKCLGAQYRGTEITAAASQDESTTMRRSLAQMDVKAHVKASAAHSMAANAHHNAAMAHESEAAAHARAGRVAEAQASMHKADDHKHHEAVHDQKYNHHMDMAHNPAPYRVLPPLKVVHSIVKSKIDKYKANKSFKKAAKPW